MISYEIAGAGILKKGDIPTTRVVWASSNALPPKLRGTRCRAAGLASRRSPISRC